jgi:dTDP-glucose 4,6-dehydratase
MANTEVVHALCDILDTLVPKPQSYRTQIAFVTDRPGHDRRYAIDAARLGRELGWTPGETFSSGLEKTVRWYLAHSDWVAEVQSGAYRDWIERNYAQRGALQ